MANVLCYCGYGTNNPSSRQRGWDGIVHMNIKPENILLAAPDLDTHRLYPCVKLADFGLAHTMGVSVAEIRYFKSARPSGGTEGYMPPEVIDRTPERERRRRHPHELIGPHCDVYSLGKSIQNGKNLLGLHYQPLKCLDTKLNRFEPETRPRLDLVYTSDLWNLMNRCQNEDARYRSKLHHLYNETKLRMENFRALAQTEEAEAFGNGIPRMLHSNVLYKRADRKRFETDPVFRSNYRKANLRPVWEILGPLLPQEVVQAEPSIALDADHSVHVNREDGAQVNERTGQQRGRLPAYVETKIEKKDKEKRKRTARVQRVIRGFLSRMNFFS